MATHPSEDFVATYLEKLGWCVRRNVRVKLTRNWTDLDLVAMPLGNAKRPCWLEHSAPLRPQVVQVKWRARFKWNLAEADPRAFLEYAWPESSRKTTLAAIAELCPSGFDWVFLSSTGWVEEPDQLGQLATVVQRACVKRGSSLRDVHFHNLEAIAKVFVEQWVHESSDGWTDDPFSFLCRLLARAGELPKRHSHALEPTLDDAVKSWSTSEVSDESSEGPLGPLYEYLADIATQAHRPTQAYFERPNKQSSGLWVSLGKRDNLYVGFSRQTNGRVRLEFWRGSSIPTKTWTLAGANSVSFATAHDELLARLNESTR